MHSHAHLELDEAIVEQINRGEFAAALQSLEVVLATNPTKLPLRNLAGLLNLQIGRADKALSIFRDLSKVDNLPSDIRLSAASVFRANGKGEEALLEYRQLLSEDPNSITAMTGEVELLAEYGEVMGALHRAMQHLESAPFSPELNGIVDRMFDVAKAKRSGISYRNYGPVVISSQPHSAGNYVIAELRRRLRLKPGPELTCHIDGWISRDRLAQVVAQGESTLDHIKPLHENLVILHHGGVEKLTVLTRDPRQAVYSTTKWYDHIKLRSGWPDWPSGELAALQTRLPPTYFDWSMDEKLNYMIETELPWTVRWLEGWLAASRNEEWGFEIHFMRHEDMKRDANSFFHEIVDFLGIPRADLLDEVRDSKKDAGAPIGDHAFRSGAVDEWRREMTDAQQARVNELVPDSLLQSLSWKR